MNCADVIKQVVCRVLLHSSESAQRAVASLVSRAVKLPIWYIEENFYQLIAFRLLNECVPWSKYGTHLLSGVSNTVSYYLLVLPWLSSHTLLYIWPIRVTEIRIVASNPSIIRFIYNASRFLQKRLCNRCPATHHRSRPTRRRDLNI
jgi:hypothetical protein